MNAMRSLPRECIHLVNLLLQFHGTAITVKELCKGFLYSHLKMEYELVQWMSFDVTIWVMHCSRTLISIYYGITFLYGFNL